ncbi:MAG: WecB/TagA/CpsF family glycosyltransferase [Clostridia bacterium]|nr:WecB/TagA/CpsF family glycosyltransferase [Clostridia bacterium]
MPRYTTILSLRFPLVSKEDALAIAHALIAARRPSAIYTPNAEIAMRAARSPAFLDTLNRADLLLPDGIGISLAAKRQGVTLPRLPGIDFAEALLATAPRPYRLFLLGARPGIAVTAGRMLSRRYPHITICGCQDGYYAPDMAHAVATAIRAAEPDLLFVCLGSPRQEEWIAVHRPPCLAIGLGGAFDVWSGAVRRAPRAVQSAGMEWLWRTLRQPSRLSRLPALAAFSARVLLSPRAERVENCQKER